MATCKSCGAEIFWAVTQKEKRMPVDKAPRDDGNLEITASGETDDGQSIVVVRYLTGDEQTLPGLDMPDRFVSHFATCPHAAAHRKAAA